MEHPITPTRDYPADVNILAANGREFIIIGTAHISQESADLVKKVIELERPDCVCVELDTQRYESLAEERKWENLDLKQIIRQKQLSTLICDRDVRITLRRAWHSMSFFEKLKLLSSGLVGVFETPEISEDVLTELRQQDVLTELLKELGEFMPVLKRVLLDERDTYIAQKTRQAQGDKIVAVVGAGHADGIFKTLAENEDRDLTEFEKIPPASPLGKWIGWGIPAIIVAAIVYIGWSQGHRAAGENILAWFLANSIPSGIGAILALAHPLTILAAFFSAPLTSLTPVIGAGYVAAFVQAYFQPPVVRELRTVGEDVGHFRKWWQNKLLRIFLVFILTSLGSLIGTYVGAVEIISNLF
jgi:pheromone shutdown-related protein TraB